MAKLLLSILFLLSACATSSEFITPDGSKAYSINCSGSMLSITQCYSKAGELCPNGYDVLRANEKDYGASTNLMYDRDGNAYPFTARNIQRRMVIRCKEMENEKS